MAHRWWLALWRAIIASLIVFALAHVPLPTWTPTWVAFAVPGVLVFLLICYLGKVLFDTLFFDHYH